MVFHSIYTIEEVRAIPGVIQFIRFFVLWTIVRVRFIVKVVLFSLLYVSYE